MDCEHIKELLLGYIDNEISDNERMLVDDHLSSCPACAMELEALAATESKLRQAYQEVTAGVSPSAGAWQMIKNKVEAKQSTGERDADRIGLRWGWLFNWRHPVWRTAVAGAAMLSFMIVFAINIAPVTVPMWTAAEQNAIDIARSDPAIQALLDGQGIVYEVIPVSGGGNSQYYQIAIVPDAEDVLEHRSKGVLEFNAYSEDALGISTCTEYSMTGQVDMVVDVTNSLVVTLDLEEDGDCLSAGEVQDAVEIAKNDSRIGDEAWILNVTLLNSYDVEQNSFSDEMVIWVRLSLGTEVYFAQVDLDERRVVKLINGGEQ